MKRAETLPNLDAQPALRLHALQQLVRAEAAAVRLRKTDPEALHDFRVALRHLRTTLSVLREHFEGVISRKHNRRLAKLGRRTGGARDAQVGLGMLAEVAAELTESAGVARLQTLLLAEAEPDHGKVIARFRKAARRLRRKLETYTVRLDPDRPLVVGSFESAVRQSARRYADRLAARLREITAETDRPAVHRARIAGKQLRYVLAPLGTGPRIASVTAELRGLQDVLGTLADVDLLTRRVVSLRAEADDEGLIQLEGRLRDLHARAFGQLRCGWLAGNSESFFERLREEL
jgi:CHAD domain-containing protein